MQCKWSFLSQIFLCQQFLFTPVVSSAAPGLNFSAFHSLHWDLECFFLIFLFPPLHQPSQHPLERMQRAKDTCMLVGLTPGSWPWPSPKPDSKCSYMHWPHCDQLFRGYLCYSHWGHWSSAARGIICTNLPLILENPGYSLIFLLLRAGLREMKGSH